jgi:hypothetical protein
VGFLAIHRRTSFLTVYEVHCPSQPWDLLVLLSAKSVSYLLVLSSDPGHSYSSNYRKVRTVKPKILMLLCPLLAWEGQLQFFICDFVFLFFEEGT